MPKTYSFDKQQGPIPSCPGQAQWLLWSWEPCGPLQDGAWRLLGRGGVQKYEKQGEKSREGQRKDENQQDKGFLYTYQ